MYVYVVVDSIESSSIVEVLKDAILRLNLAMSNCRGQCYDGAANMAGARNGVAVQMCAEEPRAVYSHCTVSVYSITAPPPLTRPLAGPV